MTSDNIEASDKMEEDEHHETGKRCQPHLTKNIEYETERT